MARIRSIKPEFWDSPDTARADLRVRLLYIAMWNWADDYGIGDGSPVRLIGFAFPRDEIPASDYPRLLADVSSAFGVVFFEHEGRPFYTIPAWERHQRTEKKAKARAGLVEAAALAVSAVKPAGQQTDTESPTDGGGFSDASVGSTGSGTGEQGNRGTGEEETCSPAPPSNQTEPPVRPIKSTEPARFAEFWATYPRRQGKGVAIKAWVKAAKKADPQAIIDGALRYATDPNRDDEYTAMAATWLNADRWTDDPLPARRGNGLPTGPSKNELNIAQAERFKSNPAMLQQPGFGDLRALPGGRS